MDFAHKVKDLARRSKHASEHALTEEATKTSIILPFIQALGFDVFDLNEVTPEFVADVGIKKGEKIDFALRVDGKPAILVEAKPISMSLGSAQYSQLFRYFAVAEVKLAILTNGREIWFFSDTDEKNKMDKKPFFVFDLQSFDEAQVKDLARFQKQGFNIESILEAASNLKFVKSTAAFLKEQLKAPSDDLVRLVGRQVYDGSLTKAVMEQVRLAVQAALDEVVRGHIQDKLNIAFRPEAPVAEVSAQVSDASISGDIVTTDDELQAFYIVRAIGARLIPVNRITMRDARSYCSIFIDDNNRKPICRLYFNAKSARSIGVFSSDKIETKVQISELTDIFKAAKDIEDAIKAYV